MVAYETDTVTFQSTLPARGATISQVVTYKRYAISIHAPREGSDHILPQCPRATNHFNPRSPRGERPAMWAQTDRVKGISIHAPREGSDAEKRCKDTLRAISIHAPREGSDGSGTGLQYCLSAISIHAPREGSDRSTSNSPSLVSRFQSTLPARGATARQRIPQYPP